MTSAPPPYSHDSRADSGLPSYHDLEKNAQDEPPPTYDSLFGRVKATKEESSGVFDFLKNLLILLLGTLGCTIILGILLALPIAMIVMGALHLHDCPAQHFIPIYLVVAGCVTMVLNLIRQWQQCTTKKNEGQEDNQRKTSFVEVVLNCFFFGWFIAGNVWIYGTKNSFSTDPSANNYCDPTLYWFAFWITTVLYMLVGISCFCICFISILSTFL